MKELSEKKARRYDKAIEVISKCKTDKYGCIIGIKPSDIFPELEDESEDEKIRKWLIEIVDEIRKTNPTNADHNGMCSRAKAWLEKQGEQMPIEGEFIDASEVRDEFMSEVYRILNVDPTNDRANQIIEVFDNLPTVEFEKQGEQKEKQYITITQKILDYIDNYKHRFENSIPKLGDSWKVIKVCKYPSVNNGKPVVEVVNEGSDDWMRLPLNIVDIKIEPNHTDKVEPKFHEGDWVVSPNGVYWHIDKISNNRYEVTSNTGESSNWPLDTNIYHRFTIQDAKDGDVLVDKSDGTIGIFQSIGHHDDGGSYNDPSYCFFHCRYDDGYFYADFENGNTMGSDDAIPATKEQRDALMKAIAEAGYTFDFEKKELKNTIDEKQLKKNLQNNSFRRMFEQKSTEWSLPYRKIETAEKIIALAECLEADGDCLFNGLSGNDYGKFLRVLAIELIEVKPAKWSEEDDYIFNKLLNWVKIVNPTSSIFEKLPKEQFIERLKDLKYRIQPKQEWSEDDERMLGKCIDAASGYYSPEDKQSMKDWLRSLKKQIHLETE